MTYTYIAIANVRHPEMTDVISADESIPDGWKSISGRTWESEEDAWCDVLLWNDLI